jgi:hypothetical protein
MTRTTFTIIFMLLAGIFLYTMSYFEKLDLVAKFSFILVVIAYQTVNIPPNFLKKINNVYS